MALVLLVVSSDSDVGAGEQSHRQPASAANREAGVTHRPF